MKTLVSSEFFIEILLNLYLRYMSKYFVKIPMAKSYSLEMDLPTLEESLNTQMPAENN